MKQTAAAFFLLCALSHAVPGQEIRAMIGVNSSKYLFSSDSSSLNHRQNTGIGLGLAFSYPLNERMALGIEAQYGVKGAKATLSPVPAQKIQGVYRNTSLSIPFLFRYQLKEGKTPYAAIGPELVFILSHHLRIPETSEDYDLSGQTKKMLPAIAIILGYEFPFDRWGFFAELRYERWLGNFLTGAEATVKSESVCFMLGGAYYL